MVLSPYAVVPSDPTTEFIVSWIDQRDGADGSSQTLAYGTDQATLSQSASATGDLVPLSDPSAYRYTVTLTGLSSDAVYYGEIDATESVEFHTLPTELPSGGLSVVVFSDAHIDRSNAMDSATDMEPLRAEDPDLVLFAGDPLTFPTQDYADDGAAVWIEFFRDYHGTLNTDRLRPFLPVPGNHDLDDNHDWDGTTATDPTSGLFQFFYENPQQLDPVGENYGRVTVGNYLQLLALDTHSAQPATVGTWLDSVATDGFTHTIPFHHSPMLPGGDRGTSDSALQAECRDAFAEVFESVGADCYFSGHLHLRSRSVPWTLIDTDPGGTENFVVNNKWLVEDTDDPDVVEFGGGYRASRTPVDDWFLDYTAQENQFYSLTLTESDLTVEELDASGALYATHSFDVPITESVTLAAGESHSGTLSWNPSDGDVGTWDATVSSADTSDTVTVKVTERTLAGTVTLNGSGVGGATVHIINTTPTPSEHVATLTTEADGSFTHDTSVTGDLHVVTQYDDGSGTQYNALSHHSLTS